MGGFFPDGKTLAAGNSDSTVIVWDVVGGKERARFKHPDNLVRNLAFSADGKMLAAAGDQHITLRDVADGKEIRTREGKNSYSIRLAFSPDGKSLAETSYNAIWLWEVATGKKTTELPFSEADKDRFLVRYNFAFAPDGKTIAAGLGECVVLWDRATGKEVKRLEVGKLGIWRLRFDRFFHRWQTACLPSFRQDRPLGSQERQTTPGMAEPFLQSDSVAISPNGKYVASSCGGDRTVRLWDAHSGKPIHEWLMPHRRIHPVLFTPDSNNVIAAGFSGECRMWSVASGKELHSFRAPGVPRDTRRQDLAEMTTGLHLSPDGKRLAALSLRSEPKGKDYVRKRYLTTWDLGSGEQKQRRPLSFEIGSFLTSTAFPRWESML